MLEGHEPTPILRIASRVESRGGAGEPKPVADLVDGQVEIAGCSCSGFQVVGSRALGHRPDRDRPDNRNATALRMTRAIAKLPHLV
jgi:hypothetical protein